MKNKSLVLGLAAAAFSLSICLWIGSKAAATARA